MFKYSKEHLEWLRVNYPSMSRKEITPAFNNFFSLSRPHASVQACLKNHKIRSGRSGLFKKGQKAWNDGIKGFMGANKTSFKKGNLPHNHKPLWSERESKDGYIEISVPERNPHTGFETRFRHKHVWIWEKYNGLVPEGFVIIFKDSDNRNFDKNNLICVTRSELLSLNLKGYKDHPEELKPSVLALAKLESKAGFRMYSRRNKNHLSNEAKGRTDYL